MGALRALPRSQRTALAEPGTIVVDAADLGPLGLHGIPGETAEVSGRRVRLVGVVHRGSSNMMPTLFCSLRTARMLLPELSQRPRHTMYLLVRCQRPDQAKALVARLRQEYPEMGTFTRESLALRTSLHWMIKTRAGVVLSFAALLALTVGALVTGQILYAATIASQREIAVLRALGLPPRRLLGLVLQMALWIGTGGLVGGLPLALALVPLLRPYRIELAVPVELIALIIGVTLTASLLSGWKALQAVSRVAPGVLLR